MAKTERITVDFPEPMAADIHAAVERGEYASTSEAVRDAVRLWAGRRQLQDHEIEALRRVWDAGKASGIVGSYDMASILRDARASAQGSKSVGG